MDVNDYVIEHLESEKLLIKIFHEPEMTPEEEEEFITKYTNRYNVMKDLG